MFSPEFHAQLAELKFRCRMSSDPVVRAYPDLIEAQINRTHREYNEVLRLLKQADDSAASLAQVKEELKGVKI